MFLGEFERQLDPKGRVSFPPQFQRELKREGVVLTPGVERCITAYPLAEWKKLAATLTASVTRSKLRKLNRAIFATAFKTTVDNQGRVALPPTLRNYADIEGEVIITGVNNYIELWNKEQWELEKADSQEQTWHIIESLERQ